MAAVVRDAAFAFGDIDGPALAIKSSWQQAAVCRDAATETDFVADTYEVAIQRVHRRDVGVQAELEGAAFTDPSVFDLGAPVGRECGEFLRSVAPAVERQLARNLALKLHALDDALDDADGDEERSMSNLHTLAHDFGRAGSGGAGSLPASCCVWNSSGTRLIVGYGRVDRSGWCEERGGLCSWAVLGRRFDPGKPDVVTEPSSYVTCLAAHPEHPALVAGGLFSGEVGVWDVSEGSDEPQVAVSPTGTADMKEPVAAVEWVYDWAGADWLVMSLGMDGRAFLWSPASGMERPVTAFKGADLPGSGSALAVSRHSRLQTTALVASEGGRIARHTVQASGAIKMAAAPAGSATGQDPRPLASLAAGRKGGAGGGGGAPGQHAYAPHVGPVYGLAFSPFHRHLFLSASADGEVRLYHQLQSRPLLASEPSLESHFLTAVRWSASRATVFAVGSADGSVYLYDLKASVYAPAATLRPDVGHGHAGAISGLAFNPSRTGRSLFATCDATGVARIWQLPQALCNAAPGDEQVLDEFGGVT